MPESSPVCASKDPVKDANPVPAVSSTAAMKSSAPSRTAKPPRPPRLWWWGKFIPLAVIAGGLGGWLVRNHRPEFDRLWAPLDRSVSLLTNAKVKVETHAALPPLPAPIVSSTPSPARSVAKEPPVPIALPPHARPVAPAAPDIPPPPNPAPPRLAKQTAPAPQAEATPAPVPATPVPVPVVDVAKWLEGLDAQWRASYEREVIGPFDKGVAELRRQHLQALESPLRAATKAGHADEAAAWQAEHDLVAKGANPPAVDVDAVPNALKLLRANFRSQFVRLDKERFDRARVLFSKCDDTLTKARATLLQRRRADEAAAVQKEEETLRVTWLRPPATIATGMPKMAAATPAPAKIPAQQIVAKLVELNAAIWVKRAKGDSVQVLSESEVGADEKLNFYRVDFRPRKKDESPLTTADYGILDSLTDVAELGLAGQAVKDSVVEKLRGFRSLKNLSFNEAKPTPAAYAVLPALPELRDLQLYNADTTDEAMKSVVQCRKLQRLHLAGLPLTDAGFTNLAKLPALEELAVSELGKLGSPAFAHLADCRALKRVYLSNFIILSGMIEGIGRCKELEAVALTNSGLKDAEVAPLGGLTKLKTLDLTGTAVTGAFIAAWPQRTQMISLNLSNAGGVNDLTCKQIEHTFPKLQDLYIKLAPSDFSSEGAAALARLRELRNVRLEGAGVTDDVVAELVRCETITALDIRAAQVSEAAVAALARLPHLASLSIDIPPVTDAAIRSFAKCKELKALHIGKDADIATEGRFLKSVPTVTVTRTEE